MSEWETKRSRQHDMGSTFEPSIYLQRAWALRKIITPMHEWTAAPKLLHRGVPYAFQSSLSPVNPDGLASGIACVALG